MCKECNVTQDTCLVQADVDADADADANTDADDDDDADVWLKYIDSKDSIDKKASLGYYADVDANIW